MIEVIKSVWDTKRALVIMRCLKYLAQQLDGTTNLNSKGLYELSPSELLIFSCLIVCETPSAECWNMIESIIQDEGNPLYQKNRTPDNFVS